MTDKTHKAQKAAADKLAEVTVRVTALGPVRHDGDTFAEGAEITLAATAAEALIRSGVAEPV